MTMQWLGAFLVTAGQGEKMEIKDSGQRREFGGPDGPVRDCSEHKGRFDLMPLNVVSQMLDDGFVGCIANFQASGSTVYLYEALDCILCI